MLPIWDVLRWLARGQVHYVQSMTEKIPSSLEPVLAPARRFLAMEQRAIFELGAFIASSPFLRIAGRGDNHPVLVLPGFTTGDRTTEPLRWYLRQQGYWVHGWRLGRNLGPTKEITEGIQHRLEELYDRHGAKVSLIGWSLGGLYARELARQNPDMVRQVITLGSPFRMVSGDRSSASVLADLVEHRFDEDFEYLNLAEHERGPITVPSTAVYTRTDGVVRWHLCIDEPGELRENVEVLGSHSGLGFNAMALWVISDRLRRAEGAWKPFRPPRSVKHLFPRPVYWREEAGSKVAS